MGLVYLIKKQKFWNCSHKIKKHIIMKYKTLILGLKFLINYY